MRSGSDGSLQGYGSNAIPFAGVSPKTSKRRNEGNRMKATMLCCFVLPELVSGCHSQDFENRPLRCSRGPKRFQTARKRPSPSSASYRSRPTNFHERSLQRAEVGHLRLALRHPSMHPPSALRFDRSDKCMFRGKANSSCTTRPFCRAARERMVPS